MTPSTSPSDRARRGRPGLAVIDTPTAPPGWEDERTQLVRIVDPLGRAVAWLAPAHGGRCVGYAVRPPGVSGTSWVHVFHSAEPSTARGALRGTGCSVQCALAAAAPDEATGPGGGWRFVERDPTAATLTTTRYGEAQLRFSADLTDGILAFNLLAENSTTQALQLRLGLHLALVGSLFRDAHRAIRVDLPEGVTRQDSGDISGGFPPGAIVRLGGSDAPLSAEITLITGVSRIRYLAPGERGLVRLVADGGDEPDGTLTVKAGGMFHLAVALQATLPIRGRPG